MVGWFWIHVVFCVDLIMNKELKHYQIINSGQEIEKTRFRGISVYFHLYLCTYIRFRCKSFALLTGQWWDDSNNKKLVNSDTIFNQEQLRHRCKCLTKSDICNCWIPSKKKIKRKYESQDMQLSPHWTKCKMNWSFQFSSVQFWFLKAISNRVDPGLGQQIF